MSKRRTPSSSVLTALPPMPAWTTSRIVVGIDAEARRLLAPIHFHHDLRLALVGFQRDDRPPPPPCPDDLGLISCRQAVERRPDLRP
jgi:hypothetical protein